MTENQISILAGNGCVCEDWSRVLVACAEQNLPAGASDLDIQAMLKPDTQVGNRLWVDISGLIAPRSEVVRLV